MFRRSFSFLVACYLLVLITAPVFASESDSVIAPLSEVTSFLDWTIDKAWFIGRTAASLIEDDVCPANPNYMDSKHSLVARNTLVNGKQGIYYVCE